MEPGALIKDLTDRIRDWRRYAPAAGSAAAHVVVLLAVGAMMAVAPPRLGLPTKPPPPTVVVTLVDESVAPPIQRPPEPNAAPTPRDVEPLPTPPKRKDDKRQATAPQPAIPSAPSTNRSAAELVPPSPPGVPLGLKKLLETNPCSEVGGRMKRGDCDTMWAKLAEEGRLGYSPTLEKLAEMFPDYNPDDPSVPFWVPKPPRQASLRLGQGGQILGGGGIMPPGAASAGGPSDLVGRLPMPIPDPAFGVDVPQWLDRDHPLQRPPTAPRN